MVHNVFIEPEKAGKLTSKPFEIVESDTMLWNDCLLLGTGTDKEGQLYLICHLDDGQVEQGSFILYLYHPVSEETLNKFESGEIPFPETLKDTAECYVSEWINGNKCYYKTTPQNINPDYLPMDLRLDKREPEVK